MNWIVFYDGECGLCSESVAFVARCDKRREFSFASLQGKPSKERGFEKYALADGGTMVVQREPDGKIFLYSDAWLEVFRALGGWWTPSAMRFIVGLRGTAITSLVTPINAA
jgi:predicted DCC family thiol-disulfide oxidoreductase YuxK